MIAQIGPRDGMLSKHNNVGFISAIGARFLERAVFDAKRGRAPHSTAAIWARE
jgi:hypothetical protein